MVSIAFENVAVSLGRREVLRGISAQAEGGRLIGIIGPNGAGKSTLIRALLGFVPHSAGAISIDGISVDRLPRAALARLVAYLPQGQTLHWPIGVERVVALGRLPHLGAVSRIGQADRAAIVRAMERADVVHLRGRIATELSGGERARVLLARALAVQAPTLVVDEPLSSLDPGHQIDVMSLLSREAQAGALVIAVLHDLTLAARHCDRLLLMDRGRLVADGSPAQVLTAERLASVYGIRAHLDPRMVVPLGRTGMPAHEWDMG